MFIFGEEIKLFYLPHEVDLVIAKQFEVLLQLYDMWEETKEK